MACQSGGIFSSGMDSIPANRPEAGADWSARLMETLLILLKRLRNDYFSRVRLPQNGFVSQKHQIHVSPAESGLSMAAAQLSGPTPRRSCGCATDGREATGGRIPVTGHLALGALARLGSVNGISCIIEHLFYYTGSGTDSQGGMGPTSKSGVRSRRRLSAPPLSRQRVVQKPRESGGVYRNQGAADVAILRALQVPGTALTRPTSSQSARHRSRGLQTVRRRASQRRVAPHYPPAPSSPPEERGEEGEARTACSAATWRIQSRSRLSIDPQLAARPM